MIFMVPLNDYDNNTIIENDEKQNGVLNALNQFKSVLSLPEFKNTNAFVLFNQNDLFMEKIKRDNGDKKEGDDLLYDTTTDE